MRSLRCMESLGTLDSVLYEIIQRGYLVSSNAKESLASYRYLALRSMHKTKRRSPAQNLLAAQCVSSARAPGAGDTPVCPRCLRPPRRRAVDRHLQRIL